MKRLAVLLAVGGLFVCGAAQGAITWRQVDFTSVVRGAISYRGNGDNVVVSGTTFYNTLVGDDYLSTKLDPLGSGTPISGNFGMYAVLNFSDPNGVFPWVQANPNTLLAIEVRAWDVDLNVDIQGDGSSDESFTLNAVDLPWWDYLTATFSEIAADGCTDIAGEPGDYFDAWIDMHLLENSYDHVTKTGQLAISIVLNRFPPKGTWISSYDATINEGDVLQGYTAGITPGSGIRVGAIPEPATILVWGLLGLIAAGYGVWRRKR